MKRRNFLAMAALYVAASALAQHPERRIAVLRAPRSAEGIREIQAFRDGLLDSGLVDGKDVVVDIRSAEGEPEALPRLAQELAALHPTVFVVGGTVSVHAVRAIAPTVPVVALIGDFSAAGWAIEFARPGAGVTGVSFESNILDTKRLELLSEVLPKHSAILNLGDGSSKNSTASALERAARSLAIVTHYADARTIGEIDAAFDTARKLRIAGINVLSSPFLNANRKRIIQLAADSRLPAIYQWPESARDGGFMAYGPSLTAMYRRMAGMVAKIVRDVPPQQIPVEQPTKFDLVINLNAAKALGMAIPQSLLLRAEELIQ